MSSAVLAMPGTSALVVPSLRMRYFISENNVPLFLLERGFLVQRPF